MSKYLYILLLFSCFIIKCSSLHDALVEGKLITTKTFMWWPNATVPFYINPDHFDHEQSAIIMTCLSKIMFKTCIKFAPVMTAPEEGQHVMTFINPTGVKRCRIEIQGHSNYAPHLVLIGYECLKSPEINMMVLRALGLPFEHNRMSRDVYIDVLIDNIEPSYLELFTKDSVLPQALRSLPYDTNSAMHFGERDYSKNGHRTIIFKNSRFRQNRYGISPLDVKKIELIYGPECRKRDRAEKVALCQSYPGIARRKREVIEPPVNRSLRVNPDITPPPHILAGVTEDENELKAGVTEKLHATNKNTKQECSLKTLGIVTEADKIIDLVYQLSNLALKNARQKYCNISSNSSSDFDFHYEKAQHNGNTSDVLGVLKILADFAKSIVDDAVRDLTEFCQNSETIEAYQRQCKFDNDTRCPKNYRASKYEAVKVTDDSEQVEEGNKSQEIDDYTTPTSLKSNRRKREATTSKFSKEIKEKVVEEEKNAQKDNLKEKVTQREEIKENVVQKEKIKEKVTQNDKLKEKVVQKEKIEEEKAQREKEIKNEGVTEMSLKHKVNALWKERLKDIQKRNSTTKILPPIATSTLKVKEDEKEILGKKLPPIITTTFKVKEKKTKENLRKFSEKRFRIQDRDSSGDVSDITLEKTALIEPEKSIANTDGSLKDLLVKGLNSVTKPAIAAKDEETAESAVTKEETKVEEAVHEKSVEEVTEKEIHKKADQSTEETETEEVEDDEMPQDKHKSKAPKRKIPKTVELSQLNKDFYTERKWPDGVVIYAIQKLPDYDLDDMRNRLEEVNTILKQKTCVKLREVNAKEAPGFEDSLILDNSPDYVTGRVGRQQNFGCIELFEGGQHKQHTAMMVMAMLGFYFEVARHDRDKFIRVHNRHIRPDKLHHFEKIAPEATLNIPYDYKSATHPSYQFWRKIGKNSLATIATYKAKDPNGSVMKSLGRNEELLSELDILKINSVYGVDCFLSKRVRKERETARMQNVEEEMVIQ